MKKVLVLALILLLLLTSCGMKEKAEEIVDKADEITDTLQEEAKLNTEGDAIKEKDKKYTTAEGVTFDGRKGEIPVNKELERFGITIRLDYVLFDDQPGSFDPPPEGMIFLYPVFTVTNKLEGGQGIYFMSGSSCDTTVDGTNYKRSMDALYSYEGKEMSTMDTDVNHGETEQFYTGLCIPEDWKEISFRMNQSFDATTQGVNISFGLKREHGSAKEIQLLEPTYPEVKPPAPRLAHENYLTKEDIHEVTGWYQVGEDGYADDVYRVGAVAVLHEEEKGDPSASSVSKLSYFVYFAKDELTEKEWSTPGAEAEFESVKKRKRFLESVPDLGDDAYWALPYARETGEVLRILHRDEKHGAYMIELELLQNGKRDWLIPLGKKMIEFLKDPKVRVTP